MLQLSSVSVPYSGRIIPGLCISAASKNEALEIAELTRAHFEIPGLKAPITVAFSRSQSGLVDFSLELSGLVGRVDVGGVEIEIMLQLLDALRSFPEYFLLLGVRSSDGLLVLPPRVFILIKSDVLIDGRVERGAGKKFGLWSSFIKELNSELAGGLG